VLSNLVNFVLALPIAIVAAALSGIPPGPALALLPLAVAIELVFLYGLTLLFATLAVPFRDFQFLVQNLVTIWFFLTPIAYPLAVVPERFRAFVLSNPATSLMAPFQRILYEGRAPEAAHFALAAAWTLLVLGISVAVFERMRGTLAEQV
jgi:lipopolysaccharide transport system permease protein